MRPKKYICNNCGRKFSERCFKAKFAYCPHCNSANKNPRDSVAIAIRLIRESKGLSQTQLNKLAGISFTGQIENGERKASVKTYAKIASALGISLKDLFA